MLLPLLYAISASLNRTKQCTKRRTLFDVYNSNYKTYIGGSRPVFVRYYTKGCHYVQDSEPYWQEAAALFPNVLFIKAECTANAINACREQSVTSSPTHALFAANSPTTPVSKFQNPLTISQSSIHFANQITEKLSLYSFDSATVKDLLPQTTNKFYNSHKYPIFLLYNSSCTEDTDFMAQMLIDINTYNVSFNDIGFGKIDCSKFPEECEKWGAKYPAANVFHQFKGISVSVTENDRIGERLDSAITFLNKQISVNPTPAPYRTPKVSPTPDISGLKKVTNKELESRSVAEIREKYYSAKRRSYEGSDCSNAPIAYDCETQILKTEAYSDFLRLLNFFRELVGLPHEVTNDESLNFGCDLAALLASKANKISHNVDDFNNRRNDCSFAANWELLRTRLDQSNLVQGTITMLEMLSGLMDDSDDSNINEVGHRKWFLYPHLKTVGIGFYPVSQKTIDYGGRPTITENRQTGVFSVSHDQSKKDDYTGVNFVSWPVAGPFPVERLPKSWSVQYSKLKNRNDVKLNNISVKITRDDDKELTVTRLSSLDQNGGCLAGNLVFVIDPESLKLCTAGHKVHVEVNIHDINEVLDYTIEFFDDQREEAVCFYKKDKSKCPSHISSSLMFGEGEYSNFSADPNSKRTTLYIAEDITPSNSLRIDYSPLVLIQGSKIRGNVTIGSKSEVDISDTSKTNVEIEVNPSNLQCGVLRTTVKSKTLSIKFSGNPSSTGRLRSLLYVGPCVYIDTQKYIDFGDNLYFFSVVYSGNNEAYLVKQTVPMVDYFCQGGGDRYSRNNCQSFNNFYEINNFKSYKKIQRIYALDPIDVSSNGFPNRKGQEYYIYSDNKLTIEYSPTLQNKADLITYQPYKTNGKINPILRFSYHFQEPLINKEILPNRFLFKNVVFNKPESNDNQYQVPDLLGDEDAIKFYSFNETEVYDESVTLFADSNGNVEYNQASDSTPLFVTNGLHDQYTFSTKNENVYIRIQPTEQTKTKQVTFIFPSETATNFKSIFVIGFDDVTIKSQQTEALNMFSLIKLVNVSRARFIDLEGNKIKGISTDVIASNDVDLSSDCQDCVTFENLYFRTDNFANFEKTECTNTYVFDSAPIISNLFINNLVVIQGFPVLRDCEVIGKVTIKIKDEIFPVIYIVGDSEKFKPTSIEITIPKLTEASKSAYLEDEKRISLFISGLNSGATEVVKKVTIVDEEGSKLEYKAVASKDQSGLFVVPSEFDENDSPETTEEQVKYIEYSINPPPPNIVYDDDLYEGEDDDSDDDNNNDNDNVGGGGNDDEIQEVSVSQSDAENGENDVVDKSTSDDKKGLSVGAIVGIVVAAVVVVAIIVIVAVVVSRKKKNKESGNEDENKEAEMIENFNEMNNSDGL